MLSRNVYNQIANFFWTMICFLPILSFWLNNGLDHWLYVFLASSLTGLFLPGRLLDSLQLSKRPLFYKNTGVRGFQKFVQDGSWIRKLNHDSKSVRVRNRADARNYLSTIAMYERYHFTCLIFFTETLIYGWDTRSWLWIAGVFVANLCYNIYPILLQQYNKIKVRGLLSRLPWPGS